MPQLEPSRDPVVELTWVHHVIGPEIREHADRLRATLPYCEAQPLVLTLTRGHATDTLTVTPSDYALNLAHVACDPAGALGSAGVGVLLRCPEGLVLTRRHPSLACAPGVTAATASEGVNCLDVPPGSTTVDVRDVAARALHEELALTVDDVTLTMLAVRRDRAEYFLLADTALTFTEITARHRHAPDPDGDLILHRHHGEPVTGPVSSCLPELIEAARTLRSS